MTPTDVITAARELLGVPFARQGRKPSVALDCAGVIIAVGETLGTKIHAPADYRQLTDIDVAMGWLRSSGLQPTSTEWKPGRVVLTDDGRRSAHVSIATDEGRIEALNIPHVARVVETMEPPTKPVAAFKFPGVVE